MNNKIIIEFGFRGISRIMKYPAQPHPIIIINYTTLYLDLWVVKIENINRDDAGLG